VNVKLGQKVTVHEYKGILRVFSRNHIGNLEYHGDLTAVVLSNAERRNSHTIDGVLESYGLGNSHAVAIPFDCVYKYFPTISNDDGFGLIGEFINGESIEISEYHILYDGPDLEGFKDCFLGVSVDGN
jgi:hypothetical protein